MSLGDKVTYLEKQTFVAAPSVLYPHCKSFPANQTTRMFEKAAVLAIEQLAAGRT